MEKIYNLSHHDTRRRRLFWVVYVFNYLLSFDVFKLFGGGFSAVAIDYLHWRWY